MRQNSDHGRTHPSSSAKERLGARRPPQAPRKKSRNRPAHLLLEALEERIVLSNVPFSRPQVITPQTDSPTAVAAADLDGDGDRDVLSASRFDNKVAWYENLGGSAYGPQRLISTAAGGVGAVTTADLDGDGDVDVLSASYIDDKVAWYENLGGGTFGPQRIISTDSNGPYSVATADLDGDGDLDVLSASTYDNVIAWYENRGDRTFGARRIITEVARTARSVIAADVDGDGDPDALSASLGDDKVAWYENLGGGSFGEQRVISTGADGALAVASADLDGDGDRDVASASFFDSKVAWYENLGGGSFGPQRVISTEADGAFDIEAVDLDGDGDADLLGGSYSDSKVAWYENLGGGRFGPQQVISTRSPGTISVASADLDGDGDFDVLSASNAGDEILRFGNLKGESATVVVPPMAGTYLLGQPVDFEIYFGYTVAVDLTGGAPTLPIVIGGSTVSAEYVSGSGTSTLTFRRAVRASDVDPDGVEVGSTIVLNGGSIRDVYGNQVPTALPPTETSGVRVDGDAPVVSGILRLDPLVVAGSSAAYRIAFSEPVTGIDASDFALLTTGAVAGARVASVTGSGASYVVTIDAGTGDGTIRLDVIDDDSVRDAGGKPLGARSAPGPVYTVRRDATLPPIDDFVTTEHADLTPNYIEGAWDLGVDVARAGGSTVECEPSEVLIFASAAARGIRPAGEPFDFLGAGANEPVWVLPQSRNPALPFLGIGAEDTPGGTLAQYFEPDSRVAAAKPWIKLALVGMRGPEGGQFALYQNNLDGPKVWMATADGIDDRDLAFAPEGSHDHYNWAFSEPGVYALDFVASGYLDANGNGMYDAGIDPYAESGVVTYYFAVETPNAQPVNHAPAAAETPRDTALAFAGGRTISITDPDDQAGPMQVSLAVTSGTLTLSSVAGLTFLASDGTADASMTVRGTIAALNAALATLSYAPEAGLVGEATLTIATDDLGYFHPDGADADDISDNHLVDVDRVSIRVTPPARVPFDRPQVIESGLNFPFSEATADLDGDGDFDLMMTSYIDKSVSWYENLGGAAFGPRRLIGMSDGTARIVAAADLDGDGDLDILAGFRAANSVTWSENLGDGRFGPLRVISGATRTTGDLKAVDVDGDGDLDVVSSGLGGGPNGGLIAWHENLAGDGSAWTDHSIGTVRSGYGVAIDDLDGDGDLDIIATSGYGDRTVVWYKNLDGDGTFGAANPIDSESDFSGVDAADFDGDGDPDIVVSSFKGFVAWYENQGGTFGPRQVLTTDIRQAWIARGADVDGDGRLDILATSVGDYKVSWFQNLGGGRFGPQQVITTSLVSPYGLAEADFDGDGDLDLIVGALEDGRLALIRNRSGKALPDVTPPLPGTYLNGQAIDVDVYFGHNVVVNSTGGVPSLPITIGSTVVQAVYVGKPDASTLRFRYIVQSTDQDGDGVVIGGGIQLNGGTLEDVNGDDVPTAIPAVNTPGVLVSGSVPSVGDVVRVGSPLTTAASVAYTVIFDKSVTGVDVADFALRTTGAVSGAAVLSVAGSGTTYTVTVATGTGDGTIRLDVVDDDSIRDAADNPLGGPGRGNGSFVAGRVYTVRRNEAPPYIANVQTSEHGDLTPAYVDGNWALGITAGLGAGPVTAYPADQILVFAPAAARTMRSSNSAYDFLGVGPGEPVWVLPQGSTAGVPFLGLSGEGTPRGTFAPYFESDPRVNSTSGWVKLELHAVRGPDGGRFALYQSGSLGGAKVWMASADGIDASDAVWVADRSHDHYSWAFTKPGVYAVDMIASGYFDANGNGVYDAGIDPYTESGVVTYYFAVEPPNAPPVNHAPAAVAADPGRPFAFRGANAISVADPDNPPGPMQVTLTATHGTLNLGSVAGLTFLAGDGTVDATLTFRGGLAALNAALATLTLTADAGDGGPATLTVTTDDLGYFHPDGADADDIPDNHRTTTDVIAIASAAPLGIESVAVNDGAAQRSMVTSLTVTFAGTVTMDPDAFELRAAGGGTVELRMSSSVVGGKTVVVLTFAGDGIINGSLADGRYSLIVHHEKVRDARGAALDGDGDGVAGGDYVDEAIHRLFGDADGDGDVDALDLEAFRSAYSSTAGDPNYFAAFDYNGDGTIDLAADLAEFNRRRTKRL